jgi:hypothetical protein
MRVESAASVFVCVTFKASVQVLVGARLVPAIHLVPQDQLNFYPYIRFGSDWVSDNDLHCTNEFLSASGCGAEMTIEVGLEC